MCVISGKVDYIVQAMDDEIKKINYNMLWGRAESVERLALIFALF